MESRFAHVLASTDRSSRRFTIEDSLCAIAETVESRASIPLCGVEDHIPPYTMLPDVFLNYMAGRTGPFALSTD
jgi:hypothetical protein